MAGLTCDMLVEADFRERDTCGSCMTIEVEFSPGMGCRVILAGKSRREKTTW